VGQEGRLLFRTQVISRDSEQHLIEIGLPEVIPAANRRTEHRRTDFKYRDVFVSGRRMKIRNMSAHGLCAETDSPLIPGDWVKVELPNNTVAFAWVLANDFIDNQRIARFRFEEAVTLPI
jgi:hypothetical protein